MYSASNALADAQRVSGKGNGVRVDVTKETPDKRFDRLKRHCQRLERDLAKAVRHGRTDKSRILSSQLANTQAKLNIVADEVSREYYTSPVTVEGARVLPDLTVSNTPSYERTVRVGNRKVKQFRSRWDGLTVNHGKQKVSLL